MRTVKNNGQSLASAVVFVAIGGLILFGLGGLAGCGSSSVANDGDEALARRQLAVVANLYSEYLQANNNLPPKDEAAFHNFLNQDFGSRLKVYNVDHLDELLVSARDKQPFVIVYGQLLTPKNSPDTPWAAYERTGIAGKRLATKVRGTTEELTPEQFTSEFPGD